MLDYLRSFRLSGAADLVLAGFVLLALALLVVPLPPLVLDLLLSLNLIAAITILLISMAVRSPAHLASFPSILLLTTLLRLTLNIASTRLILSSGHGSAVVTVFGSLVTGGDLIVGIILFGILTIVQFVVITKGAERVAEVSARFTLDAMPGKQMSIDADLRSGNINFEEAAKRRAELQVESQLYGAMDGAMKFMKGDAIAGLLITGINLVGGIAIGVLRLRMSVGQAVEIYTQLSVGDALVAQIPSMLISLGAGFLTTAVDEGKQNLGSRLRTQLLAQPRAILIAGAFLVLLALVPGMPALAFGLPGLLAIGAALRAMRKPEGEEGDGAQSSTPEERSTRADVKIARMQRAQADKALPMVTPILIEYARSLEEVLGHPESRFVRELLPELRNGLFFELGVRFPNIRLRANPWLSEADTYVIHLNEVPTGIRRLRRDRVLVNEAPARLRAFNVSGEPAENPATGAANSWVEPRYRPLLERAHMECWGPEEYVVIDLAERIRRNAARLVGLHDVKEMLNQLEKVFPPLVNEVVPKLISLRELTDLFRRLVGEGISIRDQKTVLQAVAEWAPLSPRREELMAAVRRELREYITHKYAGGTGALAAYVLDPALEDTIQAGVVDGAEGNYLALAPEVVTAFHRAVRAMLAGKKPKEQLGPVFLTHGPVRPYLRRLLEHEHPRVSVLAFDELAPEVLVNPLGRLTLDAAAWERAA